MDTLYIELEIEQNAYARVLKEMPASIGKKALLQRIRIEIDIIRERIHEHERRTSASKLSSAGATYENCKTYLHCKWHHVYNAYKAILGIFKSTASHTAPSLTKASAP